MITMQNIIEAAAYATGIPSEKIVGKRRLRELVHLRAAIVRVVEVQRGGVKSDLGRFSYPMVGKALGNRDHSSITHLRDQWPVYCRRKPLLIGLAERIEQEAKRSRAEREREIREANSEWLSWLEAAEQRREQVRQRALRSKGIKPRNDFEEDTPQAQTHYAMMVKGSAKLRDAILAAA